MVLTSSSTRSGRKIPSVGYGCWKLDKSKAADLVEAAIRDGYRHIDGACDYGNEKEVGEGIRYEMLFSWQTFAQLEFNLLTGVLSMPESAPARSSLSLPSCGTPITPRSMWKWRARGP